MKNLKKRIRLTTILLVFIFLFGALLRFWQLDTSPKGALVDELHFAYLAHSLIETGADEHGNSWPVIFEGFGDQKLPAMAYLDIPSVAIFGLSLLAIRVPSAIAGTLLILASYWLILEITRKKKWALLGALITTVSPWSFFLSRFGFESNLALLGLTIGLAALFSAERIKKNYLYILSALGFAFSWYSYIAYRPITIFLLLVFIAIKLFTSFKDSKKNLLLLIVSFSIFVLPLFSPSVIGVNSTRFDQVGITSDPGTALVVNEKRNFCSMKFPQSICFITWNKPTILFKELTHRYLLSFSPEFLVTKGELSTDFLTIDSFGQFFPPLYILLIFGVAGFLFLKGEAITKTQKWIIVLGLLVAPIPSALVGEPQKVRISALFPFMLTLIIFGAMTVDSFLTKKIWKKVFLSSLVLSLFGYSFLHQMEYHAVNSIQSEYKYQSYLPSMHKYLESIKDNSIINIFPFYSDPLMFHAFYTKMDPSVYQSLAVIDNYDGANFRHTLELGNIWAHKYSPEELSCIALEQGKKAIYVTDEKREDLFLIHEERSSNDVHVYAYVYDVTLLMLEKSCDDRKNQ